MVKHNTQSSTVVRTAKCHPESDLCCPKHMPRWQAKKFGYTLKKNHEPIKFF